MPPAVVKSAASWRRSTAAASTGAPASRWDRRSEWPCPAFSFHRAVAAPL